jgi:hypothetical protein
LCSSFLMQRSAVPESLCRVTSDTGIPTLRYGNRHDGNGVETSMTLDQFFVIPVFIDYKARKYRNLCRVTSDTGFPTLRYRNRHDGDSVETGMTLAQFFLIPVFIDYKERKYRNLCAGLHQIPVLLRCAAETGMTLMA